MLFGMLFSSLKIIYIQSKNLHLLESQNRRVKRYGLDYIGYRVNQI